MTTQNELLFEAARRGLLTGEKKAAFEEAMRRGIISPPTIPQEELDAREQPQFEEPGFGQKAAGVVENLGSFASGVIAEPISGVAGIAAGLNPFGDQGDAAAAVKATREALTLKPKTEAGISQQQATGKALAPVAKVIKGTEEFLGGGALELTGSPAIAAAAATLPTAALELLGLKGSKRFTKLGGAPTKKQVRTAVVESAPEIRQLKEVANLVYDEISNSGVRIKRAVTSDLGNSIKADLVRQGFNSTNNPKINGLFREIDDVINNGADLSRMQILRKTASNAAEQLNSIGKPTDTARLATRAVSRIDKFFESVSTSSLEGANKTAAVATARNLKSANKLWGRALRAETIDTAIRDGSSRAAGAEAGIRNELNRILNNKSKSKFFPKEELASMRKVVDGSFGQNFTRLIGKMGISIDRSPGLLQATLASGSAGIGGLLGLGSGGIILPAIGSVSKQIAKNLTTNKAKFLSTITRAGPDAEKIAKAYLSIVPKSKRRVEDLAGLLSDVKVDLAGLETIANKTIQDALEIAKGRRQLDLAAAAGTGAAAPRTEDPINDQ